MALQFDKRGPQLPAAEPNTSEFIACQLVLEGMRRLHNPEVTGGIPDEELQQQWQRVVDKFRR